MNGLIGQSPVTLRHRTSVIITNPKRNRLIRFAETLDMIATPSFAFKATRVWLDFGQSRLDTRLIGAESERTTQQIAAAL